MHWKDAVVLDVTAASTDFGSTLKSSVTSANTGMAPSARIALPGGQPRHGGGNHLITRANTQSPQRKIYGRGAIGKTNGVRLATTAGKFGFELLNGVTKNQISLAH